MKQIIIDGTVIAEIQDNQAEHLKDMAKNGPGFIPAGDVMRMPIVVGEDIGVSLLIAFKNW